jgi:hypothetical protein
MVTTRRFKVLSTLRLRTPYIRPFFIPKRFLNAHLSIILNDH